MKKLFIANLLLITFMGLLSACKKGNISKNEDNLPVVSIEPKKLTFNSNNYEFCLISHGVWDKDYAIIFSTNGSPNSFKIRISDIEKTGPASITEAFLSWKDSVVIDNCSLDTTYKNELVITSFDKKNRLLAGNFNIRVKSHTNQNKSYVVSGTFDDQYDFWTFSMYDALAWGSFDKAPDFFLNVNNKPYCYAPGTGSVSAGSDYMRLTLKDTSENGLWFYVDIVNTQRTGFTTVKSARRMYYNNLTDDLILDSSYNNEFYVSYLLTSPKPSMGMAMFNIRLKKEGTNYTEVIKGLY